MKQFSGFVQKYLIFVSPVVLATLIWGSYESNDEILRNGSFALKALWEVMSWSLMIWFLLLFVFVLLLGFRKETQESTIKYLAGITERDEREEVVMGLAAKRSFIATSGFLVLLLFLSCFTLTIAKLPPEQVVDGHKSTLTIGFHFAEADSGKTVSPDGRVVYEHHDLPLSKSSIILMILLWQVGIFRFRARNELRIA